MIIILIFVFVLLLLAAALMFERSEFSLFELERRVSLGDRDAKRILKKEGLIDDILALRHLVVALLLIVMALVAVYEYGWVIGVIVAILLTVAYVPLSRLEILQSLSKKMYKYIEKPVANFVSKFPVAVRFLCGVARGRMIANLRITSREELQYLVSESGKVLTEGEKLLIINSLSFIDLSVKDIMTPRSMLSTINKGEFLGPLSLDELYKKSGHSHLPVIDGDIDHIIGILNLKNLLNLDTKHSSTAEQVMDKRIYYIRQDHSLDYAMSAFLKTHSHLLVVINEFRETVGLLSLGDVIEELLGQGITDDFDMNDDIHAVAMRNPKKNNVRNSLRIDV